MATIRAKITKVEQQFGSEWFRIATDHDEIKRLDTKRRELAVLAEQIRQSGNPAEIEFNSRPGRNINPHTNQPYINHYFEGALPLKPEAQVEIPIGDAPVRAKTDPDEAWRMCLNKGGELAVLGLEYTDPSKRSFEHQKQVAIGWAYFFMTEPFPRQNSAGNGASQFQPPESVRNASAPGAYDEPEFASVSDYDDSIPF